MRNLPEEENKKMTEDEPLIRRVYDEVEDDKANDIFAGL